MPHLRLLGGGEVSGALAVVAVALAAAITACVALLIGCAWEVWGPQRGKHKGPRSGR